MMIGVFALYLFSAIAILAKKKKLAWTFAILGILCAALFFWYHITLKLQINL
ncbi:MAG: DUF5993 family protein [Chlamydiales bacterium]